MKIENDTELAEWILDEVNFDAKPNSAEQVIPNKFQHYFKLFLPLGIEDDENGQVQKLTPEQLAELAGLKYSQSFSITDVISKFKGFPSNLVTQKFDDHFIKSLQNILGNPSKCIYYGIGDDIVPEEFEIPWVVDGTVEDLNEIILRLNKENDHYPFKFFPNFVYAKNMDWGFGWKVQVNEVGLLIFGCNERIKAKLIDQDIIDYQKINITDNYIKFLKPS